uniref:alpha/beta fold hydrolase n=1 Tax=Bradyrhizobium sp. (strain ORS 278) TaxID=114615 RepID=UPI0002E4CA64|nr:alpha/beta fold hydrolase [Bradyrhizobium sp. ORS 278]
MIAFLPGAGGDAPDLDVFRIGPDDPTQVKLIAYPGWRRYITEAYSADALIDDLCADIVRTIPTGPVRLVGVSLGGHLAYAAALRLRAQGREISGVCAIDSMMIQSSGPSAGWRKRALEQALEQMRERRLIDLWRFLRSRLWRGLARALGDGLPGTARRASRTVSVMATLDPIFEQELSMRLLLRLLAPALASIDRDPVALDAPAVLLRTPLHDASDAAWRRRCPCLNVREIPGKHHTLFDPENVGSLRQAFLSATPDWR